MPSVTSIVLSLFLISAGPYARADHMAIGEACKRFGDCEVALGTQHGNDDQFVKVNSYGDWREVRASAKEQALRDIEKAVGMVKEGKMAGTGFVVDSGARENRDFEVIVLNAHAYYDDDCKRKPGPFRFFANAKLKSNPGILHLFKVGTKCPYQELDKDWAIGIVFGRLRDVIPIQYAYLRDDEIGRVKDRRNAYNMVGHNVKERRIDSVNLAKAECRPFTLPKYRWQSRQRGLGANNFLHNCPVEAGMSGGPLVRKARNDDGADSYLALGIHSGEFYSLKKKDSFDIKYNANVAVRFYGELRRAISDAGKLNSFAAFQAEMRRRNWLVTSGR